MSSSARSHGSSSGYQFKQNVDTKEKDPYLQLREVFAILTQGVEIIQYDCRNSKRGVSKFKRILWMEAESLRICCDATRPSIDQRNKGFVPPGLYIRDIAEVRAGDKSYDFQNSSQPPAESKCCLSLIGSERSISIEYPSEFTRDWFLERLRLIQEDVMSVEEKAERNRIIAMKVRPLTPLEIEAARRLIGVLRRGIQIKVHHPTAKIYDAMLTYDSAKDAFVVTPATTTLFLGFGAAKSISLSVQDIAEIRPGIHSIGFVRTNSTDKETDCLSLVGTECTIDIQLTNEGARNVFIDKLRILVYHVQSNFSDGLHTGKPFESTSATTKATTTTQTTTQPSKLHILQFMSLSFFGSNIHPPLTAD